MRLFASVNGKLIANVKARLPSETEACLCASSKSRKMIS